ncbi:MAG: hypothetical protein Q4B54_13315, partial [Coriobacteriales bacterium]|nr:hypothetical protein [Coriobacteriales bacterium]
MSANKVLVVGIAGGSGSGKTTFAHALCERLHTRAAIIPHDNYYRAQHELTLE